MLELEKIKKADSIFLSLRSLVVVPTSINTSCSWLSLTSEPTQCYPTNMLQCTPCVLISWSSWLLITAPLCCVAAQYAGWPRPSFLQETGCGGVDCQPAGYHWITKPQHLRCLYISIFCMSDRTSQTRKTQRPLVSFPACRVTCLMFSYDLRIDRTMRKAQKFIDG